VASALTYLERLLEDDYVQEQIGEAAGRLRDAYRRAADRRAAEAVQDKKLYEQLRVAAASLVNAARGLRGKPPPKRRARRVLVPAVIAIALGAVIWGRSAKDTAA
jgi:hypothetical protein